MPRGGLADQEGALKADIHGRVPRGFRQLFELARHDAHCVIDHDVDATAFLHGRFNQPSYIGCLRDVRCHRETVAAELGGVRRGRFGRRRIDIVNDDVRTFARVSECDIAPDAAPSTGDDGHFVL